MVVAEDEKAVIHKNNKDNQGVTSKWLRINNYCKINFYIIFY